MDDTELLAAIGRIVVQAALLEYSVATLVAVLDGLRDEACEARAVEIVSKPGEAMRQFRRVAKGDRNLTWLMREADTMLGARHFIAHAVAQQDAIAEGRAALFILVPRQGETMITTRQAVLNARLIAEGVGWVQDAIAVETGQLPGPWQPGIRQPRYRPAPRSEPPQS